MISGRRKISFFIGFQCRVAIPDTIYTQTTKIDLIGCIYVFVRTYTIYICIINNQREKNYQLESQRTWEGTWDGLEGGKEVGNDITLFQLKIYLRTKSCSRDTIQDGAKKDKKPKKSA